MKKLLVIPIILIAAIAQTQPTTSLTTGTSVLSLNANAGAAPQNGTSFQSSLNTITWNVTFASAPASQTTLLQTSNNNSTWATADTSTNVNGESRTIFTVARFVRAQLSAKSGGGAVTVSIIGRNSPVANTALSSSSNLSVASVVASNFISSGANPAQTGGYRLPNNVSLAARNAANSGDVSLIYLNPSNQAALSADLVGTTNITGFGTIQPSSAGFLCIQTRNCFYSPSNGLTNVAQNSITTTGIQFNVGTAKPTAGTGCTSIQAQSTNMAGQLVASAGACTINFGAPAWTNTPFCQATEVTAARALFISAASTTAITVSGLTAADTFNYSCMGSVF